MAVYTEVSDAALRRFFEDYALGGVVSCKGIAEGVENSNYLVVTDSGPFILTLYEKRVAEGELPFFIALMEHLAGKGIPCPLPVHDRSDKALKTLCGRPACVTTFLPGMWPRAVTPMHCRELGRMMAALHAAAADFPMYRANSVGPDHWPELFAKVESRADSVIPGLAEAISTELTALAKLWPNDLPAGVIHADLFPDNVFFQDEQISGVIDFYFACNDLLAYELAIAINAWCFDDDHRLDRDRATALMAGYQEGRALDAVEASAMPVLCRGAALRFLLTRLFDWLNRPEGALVMPKDPNDYLARLRRHQTITDPGAYGL